MYRLNSYGWHCCRASVNENEKDKPGLLVSQLPPTDLPTVSSWVDPPAPKPVESDMVKTIRLLALKGMAVENDPFPLLNAEEGIEMFLNTSKTGKMER